MDMPIIPIKCRYILGRLNTGDFLHNIRSGYSMNSNFHVFLSFIFVCKYVRSEINLETQWLYWETWLSSENI